MNAGNGKSLNWRLIIAMVPIGLLFAALTITGVLPGVRPTQWAALASIATIGIVVGLRAPNRPVLHALIAGFLAGFVAVETQALFLDTYFVNNPQYADIETPFGWSPRLVTILGGPVNGALAALVAGLFGWLSSKLRRNPQAGARTT